MNIDRKHSKEITDSIDIGNLSKKPGWVRISFHPIMTNDEIYYIAHSIKETIENINNWKYNYEYNSKTNEFFYRGKKENTQEIIKWLYI